MSYMFDNIMVIESQKPQVEANALAEDKKNVPLKPEFEEAKQTLKHEGLQKLAVPVAVAKGNQERLSTLLIRVFLLYSLNLTEKQILLQ